MSSHGQIPIADDLASLPLPPDRLWVPARRSVGPRLERFAIAALVATLVVAVAFPLVDRIASERRSGATATTSPATRVNVVPGDVRASATLLPVGDFAVAGVWNYLVDMTFDNTAPDGDYDFDVYPYLGGTPAGVFDFGQGFDASGRVIGGTGITSGSNGSRLAAAGLALRNATPPAHVQGTWQTEGVSFVGNRGPLRVRFVVKLPAATFPLQPDEYRLVVVYSTPHDSQLVTWTKVVPITLSTGASTPPVRAALGARVGKVALGMAAADVQRILGEPTERTITHGQGGPEWHYANGLIVHLTGATTEPGQVWEIFAQHPFTGATAEGVGIGSPIEEVRRLVAGFTSVQDSVELRVADGTGTTLDLHFDAGGRVDWLVLRLPL